MRRVFLLLPLLAGCAAGPGLQARMAGYIGAPEGRLVQELGVPDKQITVDGVQYLAYMRRHAEVEPEAFAYAGPWGWGGGPYWDGGFALGLPQDVQVWSCETTFSVKDGQVAGVTFKGNDCR